MSKLSKLIRDPKLFFIDSYKKRTKQFKLKVNRINDSVEKQVTENKLTKKRGYRYYLENYTEGNIQKNLVLFDSFWGRKIGCHPYAIYKAMASSNQFQSYEFIWVKEEGVEIPEDVAQDSRVSFVEYTTKEYAQALLEAEILISNSNFSPYFSPKPGQYVVSTWHGIPMKTLGYDANNNLQSVYNTQRNLNVSDLIVSSSDFYTNKVVGSYGAYLSFGATKKLGSPRIDLTLNADVKAIKNKLNIPLNRKVILYAPTWRGKIGEVSSDIDIQIEVIRRLETLYSQDYEILVSLHHLTKKSLGADLEKLKIQEVTPSVDINEVLAVCDIVISDYSSIYLDFLCLDRPIILYTPDLEEYERHRGLYLSASDLPVNIAKDIEELTECIKNLKRPSEFNNYPDVIRNILPLEDGKSSQRVIEKILMREKNLYEDLKQKENILITVGGLAANGITKSLSNLLKNIDYDRFNIFLLVNAKLVDASVEKQVNLNLLNKKAHNILTIAPKNFSKIQDKAYRRLASDNQVNNVDLHQIDLAFRREMRRLFGKFEFDHAIDYTGYSVYWTNCVSAISAKNKIVFQHSDMFAEANNKQRKFNGLHGVFQLYNKFNKIVSVSYELLNENKKMLSHYVEDDRSFYYLPNLLSVDDIKNGSNSPLSIMSPSAFLLSMEKDLIKFVCVARLSPEKGHLLLLKSFKKVIDAGVNASLSIVGKGVMEKELKTLSQTLQIENRVIFHGHINEPYPIIKNSDCFILLSDYEGQGLAYLEAMTLGVPCIGSNLPVVKSLITPYGGTVVDFNEDSASNAMISFAENGKCNVSFNADEYLSTSKDILYNDVLHL